MTHVCRSHLSPERQETLHPGPSAGAACLTCRDTRALSPVTLSPSAVQIEKYSGLAANVSLLLKLHPPFAQRCYSHRSPTPPTPRLQGKANVSAGTAGLFVTCRWPAALKRKKGSWWEQNSDLKCLFGCWETITALYAKTTRLTHPVYRGIREYWRNLTSSPCTHCGVIPLRLWALAFKQHWQKTST